MPVLRARSFLLSLLACSALCGPAGAASLTPAAEPGALPTVRVLSSEVSLALARAALAACADKGWPVAVAVTDAAAVVRTQVSADGVKALTIETARRKARTAALVNAKTSDIAKWTVEAPRFEQVLSSLDREVVFIGGGVPVVVAGQLVGAIGVGGAPRGNDGAEHDEACAQAAITALAARLK